MTREEMSSYVEANLDRIIPDDAWYLQYKRIEAVRHALDEAYELETSSPATDQVIFTIGTQALSIQCFDADSIGIIDRMLHELQELAVSEIYVQ